MAAKPISYMTYGKYILVVLVITAGYQIVVSFPVLQDLTLSQFGWETTVYGGGPGERGPGDGVSAPVAASTRGATTGRPNGTSADGATVQDLSDEGVEAGEGTGVRSDVVGGTADGGDDGVVVIEGAERAETTTNQSEDEGSFDEYKVTNELEDEGHLGEDELANQLKDDVMATTEMDALLADDGDDDDGADDDADDDDGADDGDDDGDDGEDDGDIAMAISAGNELTHQGLDDGQNDEEFPKQRNPVYLTVHMAPGRLGNDLFRYAALRGIAARTNMTPILLNPTYKVRSLADTFLLQTGIIRDPDDFQGFSWLDVREAKAATYDARTEALGLQHAHLRRFLQSHKYFSHIEEDLRKDLTFQPDIADTAVDFLRNATRRLRLGLPGVTYIGIHARRTSFTKVNTGSSGYVTPPPEYYLRAAEHVAAKYLNPVYVMCSDDMGWCKQKLVPNLSNPVIVSEHHSPVEDMAILAHCNHTVISVGTFGWWAAWLAGGDTVYYKDFPRPGSKLAGITNLEDYYPPHWTPM